MAFTVLDFETTGLSPERGDRVIEIGLVLVDDSGQIEHEWTSLINPRRDVGATHIHGLRGGDLLDAPEFYEIADEILNFVSGRTVVAHSATFDMRFLFSELVRAGYKCEVRPPALCSMKWSGKLVGPAKLQHVCDALDIELANAHSALADARATAALLKHLMRLTRSEQEWAAESFNSKSYKWPMRRGGPRASPVVRGETQSMQGAWLESVLNAVWVPGVPEDEASYLLVLDRALLDRSISRSEGRQLVDAAKDAGLSGAKVAQLHYAYLRSLAMEALSDGVISNSEEADIHAVAGALGLTGADVTAAILQANEAKSSKRNTNSFSLARGDRIVFTGETSRPRDDWVTEIVAAGLTSGGVTKSTKLVVAADPDSLSGKAAKARAYAVPIVDEKTFAGIFQKYCSG